jgi:hypothetical protein
MFYLVYNNYPLTYTIPFAGLFFIAVCGTKINFNDFFNKRIKKIIEGFEGFSNILEDKYEDEDEDDNRYEEEVYENEEDEDDKTKMLDELLDELDDKYSVLEEAHKQHIEN